MYVCICLFVCLFIAGLLLPPLTTPPPLLLSLVTICLDSVSPELEWCLRCSRYLMHLLMYLIK